MLIFDNYPYRKDKKEEIFLQVVVKFFLFRVTDIWAVKFFILQVENSNFSTHPFQESYIDLLLRPLNCPGITF